jgi:GntR family transcriptional regulator / MocR family aminotransferase
VPIWYPAPSPVELPLVCDRKAGTSLYRQLCEQIRKQILAGRLAPNSRLPATRELAQQLGVSRNTVTNVYDQLVAEGYLEARTGAWTYVASHLPTGLTARRPSDNSGADDSRLRLSHGVKVLLEGYRASFAPRGRGVFDFSRFAPALDAFPTNDWRRILSRNWQSPSPADLGYADAQGDPALRRAIAIHLSRARGVTCSPEQIVVTTGSQQAFDVLADTTLDPGRTVLIENPGYVGARAIFAAHGARLQGIPVDGDGVAVSQLSERADNVRLIYVTPSHQFPTGVTLSLPRRLELLRWAAAHSILVVEDDYDSEFRYEGGSLESLQGLDTHHVVAYVGTFSKVLSPALRVGYVVLPPSLVEPFVAAKSLTDRHTASSLQAALAEFLDSGLFARHLRRLSKLHRVRRDALLEALQAEFGGAVQIGEARAGLHVHVRFCEHPATEEMLARALNAGVSLFPVSGLHIHTPSEDPGVLMAFAAMPENLIREGVRVLHRALQGHPG